VEYPDTPRRVVRPGTVHYRAFADPAFCRRFIQPGWNNPDRSGWPTVRVPNSGEFGPVEESAYAAFGIEPEKVSSSYGHFVDDFYRLFTFCGSTYLLAWFRYSGDRRGAGEHFTISRARSGKTAQEVCGFEIVPENY
jgi:hypothetical protein